MAEQLAGFEPEKKEEQKIRDKLVSHVMDELSKCRDRMHNMEQMLIDSRNESLAARTEICERLRLVESRAGSTEANLNAFSLYFHSWEDGIQGQFKEMMSKLTDMHDTVNFIAEGRKNIKGFVNVSGMIASVIKWCGKWIFLIGGWFTGIAIVWHMAVDYLSSHYPIIMKWKIW